MPPVIQVVLGRILAAIVSAAIGWLVGKGILNESQVTAQDIPEIVAWITGTALTLYGVGHTWYNSKFNKKDVSSPTLLPAAQADAHRQEAQIKDAAR